VDSFGKWALCTLVGFVLALMFGSFLFAIVLLIISAEIAVVLWTPLRGWLEIPERLPDKPRPRTDLADQGLEP
jgi:ABC-type microcin C transport system permease subunit YejB